MYIDPTSQVAKDARILIVDDDERNILGLKRHLEREGYAICISVTDPRKAVARFVDLQPDIVLLDWHMDQLPGLIVLQAMKARVSADKLPPILVLTADSSPETKREALAAGATDFLSKPLDVTEVLLRIRNLLQLRMLHQRFVHETEELEDRVKERTSELEATITELREVQQQVLQQERLHALGLMAGGVAHDFNNILMIIKGYSDMFLEQGRLNADPEEIRDCFVTISRAANDAAEIVRRLREFYRPFTKGEDERKPVNINELVHEAVKLCRPKWHTDTQARGIFVDFQTDLQGVPPVPACASEIREVLVNLIFNAVDAMPQGGGLRLRSGIEEGSVFFEVEDSGTGMTEETRLHCLEPFYTTKGERGSGLGLAIIYGIVRRHSGQIRIRTELNEGTCVRVLLPQSDVGAQEVEEPSQPPVQRGLRVLVVDDQPPICVVLRHYLQQDSHRVVTAGNGCEALEKFRAEEFDLVIADRVMPKMNGDQLATAIKEIEPGKPFILLTAFAGESRNTPTDVDLMLSKPASLRMLREAITKVMAA